MRKKMILLFSFLLLFYSCKDNSRLQNTVDDVSLEKLELENDSILERFNENLFYDFGEVEKYSVSLMLKAKNENAIDVKVMTNGEKTIGVHQYYDCKLADGSNEIKIISSSKKDASNQKIYKIRITKKISTAPNNLSSRLKELKVDGNSILSSLDSKNIAELPDVVATKDKVTLYVEAHNTNAEVDISNEDNSLNRISDKEYDISLDFGLNRICVVITSEAEGAKQHIIKIYREEDLSLKSFSVDGTEYCENGKIKKNNIRFMVGKTEAIVQAKAKADYATLIIKNNEKEIPFKNGSYRIPLELGRNAIEVVVRGKGGVRSKSYDISFTRPSPSNNDGKLLMLKADDKDLLNLLSKDNTITLAPYNNDKTVVKIEAKATHGINIKVLNNDSKVSGNGIYNVSLMEGNNRIVVQLYSSSNLIDTYSIFVIRYPKEDSPKSPSAEEVQIKLVLSDGVNGSPVDGSYVNIFKTKETTLLKRVLIRNGKVNVNLEKNQFYDFKVEGRNTYYSRIRYAASDVISYFVDGNTKVIPIIQYPLQRLTRPAEAPIIKGVKFNNNLIQTGVVNPITYMQNVNIEVETSAPIEKLQDNSPYPMLGVGFVPTDDGVKDVDVFYAEQYNATSKNANGKYESAWRWSSLYNIKLIKGDIFDVILVLYDIANNRIEYHTRFNTSGNINEDNAIKVNDMKIELRSYPTPSRTFSVGEDAFTKKSSHYTNKLKFKVKDGANHIQCIGFDIYRKCVEDGDDFRVVKHFVYDSPRDSSETRWHRIYDNDGVLEDEKTYKYKVIAYTNDGKKSVLDSSDEIEIKIPKSTSLLLEYPLKQAISLSEAQNMDYVFKLSNPKILDTAKEIHLGFLLSDRTGTVLYASKFKYVFDDSNGKDEIYFATINDAKFYQNYYYIGTDYSIKRNNQDHGRVEELIKIDKSTGTIRLTKRFTALTEVNLMNNASIYYSKGTAFYWDIVDWGINAYSDADDRACKIISKEINGVTITSETNDVRNGNNAWNGRAEFTIKFD
ncbi:MAG: dentilisin complex subunit PrcA [Treponema sp.]